MIPKAVAESSCQLGDGQLHHDNAATHSSRLTEFFGDTSNRPGDSDPYNPDLVPCDFWLFPKLKSPLKGKKFDTIDEIQENMTELLMAIGRNL